MSVPSRFDLIQEAAAFASRRHRHQTRNDGRTPYASHLFRVAMTVRHQFGCEDPIAIAAALLHDTIEDTTTDYDDLLEAFGVEVADIVAALTKNMTLREDIREEEYDARLAKADWRARLIKLADTYDNYCDSTERPRDDTPTKHFARCLRAVELARPDGSAHPEIARAIALVQDLLRTGAP